MSGRIAMSSRNERLEMNGEASSFLHAWSRLDTEQRERIRYFVQNPEILDNVITFEEIMIY